MNAKPACMAKAIMVLAVLGGLVGTAVPMVRQPAGPIHTVAQVVAGLKSDPARWAGRTVVVRGTLAMVMGHGGGTAMGTWSAYCAPQERCRIGVGEGVPLHMFLVERLPHTEGAYLDLVTTLAGVRSTWPPTWDVPPNLVVVAPPRRQQQAAVALAQTLQRVADSLPSGVEQVLAQVPLISRVVWPLPTVQGGTPRLYRVRLFAQTPQLACLPVCDDGVLLDSPY